MVDGERVAVRVLEEGLVADAAVDDVAPELHATRLQLGLGALEVVDPELDRVGVRLELEPEGVRLHDRDRQVAGLELAGGHRPPALGLLEAEHVAVERRRGLEVLGRDGDEVGAGDESHRRSLRGSRTVELGIPLMRSAPADATINSMLDTPTSVTVIHGAMLSFETITDRDARQRPRPRAARDAAAGDRRDRHARAGRRAADADARGRGPDRVRRPAPDLERRAR